VVREGRGEMGRKGKREMESEGKDKGGKHPVTIL